MSHVFREVARGSAEADGGGGGFVGAASTVDDVAGLDAADVPTEADTDGRALMADEGRVEGAAARDEPWSATTEDAVGSAPDGAAATVDTSGPGTGHQY